MFWVVTLSGVLAILGLSSYQGYTWHKRAGGGFLSLVATLACGFVVGLVAVLGAEALATPEYFFVTWDMEGLNQRQVAFGLILGTGPAAVGWLTRRGQKKRQGSTDFAKNRA